MVAVGVGDEDVRHLLAGEVHQQRLDMLGEVGAGVDDRDLALADHIGAGAAKGERAGIARDDPADAGGHRLQLAVIVGEVAAERDVDGHGRATPKLDRL